MSLVKWAAPLNLHSSRECGFNEVPVIPLAALTEVVEGLKLSLDYYRSIGTRKYNPYEVEQTLEKLLTQLEAHGKEGV